MFDKKYSGDNSLVVLVSQLSFKFAVCEIRSVSDIFNKHAGLKVESHSLKNPPYCYVQ